MIKTITISGQPVKFEATTGTGELYQIFTGRNIYDDYIKLMEIYSRPGIDTEDTTSIIKNLSMDEITGTLDLIKKMGFVMYIQANTEGETPVDKIRNIKARLNGDEYLAWILGIEQEEFNGGLFEQFVELMGLNGKTTVIPKN
jgi:hypothetical protein